MPKAANAFIRVPCSFFKHQVAQTMSPRAGWLLFALYAYANKERTCYPGIRALSDVTGMSRGSIIRAKKELREKGWIKYRIEHLKKGTRCFYTLRSLDAEPLDVPDNLLQAPEATTFLKALKSLDRKYPKDAAFLRTHSRDLRALELFPAAVQFAEDNEIDLRTVRIYYLLDMLSVLRTTLPKSPLISIRLVGHLSSSVRLANAFFSSSTTLKLSFEKTICAFIDWLERRKPDKSLHLGILPLLAGEWAAKLKKK